MRSLMIIGLLIFAGCARNTGDVTRILEGEGCTDIVDKGADIIFSGCSDRDFYNNQFTCTKNGKNVSGVVCSGLLFKGATIRYF